MSGVNVKIDLKGVEKKVSPENFAKGQLAIAEQMVLDMDRFVPKRGGELRSKVDVRKGSIVYKQPYARLLFYGKKGKHKKTPGTGPRWDKKASALYAKNWAEVGAKAMGVK